MRLVDWLRIMFGSGGGAPAPPPTAPPHPPTDSPVGPTRPPEFDQAALVAALLDAHNRLRATALRINLALNTAAFHHSISMALSGQLSHTGPDGSTLGQRLHRVEYSYSAAGENIAARYKTVASVVAGWMNSPGHRANILNPAFTEVGFGVAMRADGTTYWTACFGRPAAGASTAEVATVILDLPGPLFGED